MKRKVALIFYPAQRFVPTQKKIKKRNKNPNKHLHHCNLTSNLSHLFNISLQIPKIRIRPLNLGVFSSAWKRTLSRASRFCSDLQLNVWQFGNSNSSFLISFRFWYYPHWIRHWKFDGSLSKSELVAPSVAMAISMTNGNAVGWAQFSSNHRV